MGNRQREQRVSLLTDRMGMSDRCIPARPLGHLIQIMVGSEGRSRQSNRNRSAQSPTEDINLPGLIGIVSSLVRQHAGQQQCHFRIVRRLACDGVPSAHVGKFTDAIRVFPQNDLRRLKLD
jgi:hypothetical protein